MNLIVSVTSVLKYQPILLHNSLLPTQINMTELLLRIAHASDLFFNNNNINYEEECKKEGTTDQKIEIALLEDAKIFFEQYGEFLQNDLPTIKFSPNWFVKDFLRRL